MAAMVDNSPTVTSAPPVAAPPVNRPPETTTVRRHSLTVRLTHWVSAVCLYLLLLSGLQIFNAHPSLYWGQQSQFDAPFLSLDGEVGDDGQLQGVTTVFGHKFDTTGWLGVSGDGQGGLTRRGFPSWLTIPSTGWLAMGRRWHFFFAWVLVLTGLIYTVHALWRRHIRRDLLPTRADWRGIGRSIIDHALLRHPKGEAAARYNVLQKISYLGVIFGLAPLMIVTGLAMSPRMDTLLGWFLTLVGGRQSARSLHFLATLALVGFVAIHLFEVAVTGLLNNLRSMITGRFRYATAPSEPASAADVKGTSDASR